MSHTIHLSIMPRYLGALVGGACGATVLVWLMAQLIDPGDLRLAEPPPIRIDHYEVRPDRVIEVKPTKPPVPIEPVSPPTAPPSLIHDPISGTGMQLAPPTIGEQRIRPYTGIGDGEVLPLVRVRPIYPDSAARRGIEGYVVVSFTVTAGGAVTEVVILESVPFGVFDRAALRAIAKFKYRPRVVDGRKIPVSGVTHRISFELADG